LVLTKFAGRTSHAKFHRIGKSASEAKAFGKTAGQSSKMVGKVNQEEIQETRRASVGSYQMMID